MILRGVIFFILSSSLPAAAQSATPAFQDVCELRPDFCSDSASARKKTKKMIKERKAAAQAEAEANAPVPVKKCRNAADSYNLDDDLPLCREARKKKKPAAEGSLEEFMQAEDEPAKQRQPASSQTETVETMAPMPQVNSKPRKSISFSSYIRNNSSHPAISKGFKTEQTAFQYGSRTPLATPTASSVETQEPSAPTQVGSDASADAAQSVRESQGEASAP